MEMDKAYDAHKVEAKWYQYWLDQGVFDAEVNPDKQPYCIVIPPPNVTGVLHMGHALDETIQDLLIRWHRMQGYETLWLPGTDHAGIATQNVVEAMLAEEGLSRHDLGREKFVECIWEVKEEHHKQITDQLQRLGVSVDWRRERFTLDEGLSRAVREAFVRLYEEGLIYRGARMINWCPRCGTSLSDLEVDHKDQQGHLWYIRYPAPDGGPGLVVATTRPETMLGDTAVAVHPNDERYQDVIGKTVTLPLMNREIPVIADDYIDPEFGTGALKVTPAHDPNDLAIAQRHNLPSVVVIDRAGKMTAETKQYADMERYECRRRVVADLEAEGLLEKIEDYQHAVGHCQRCDTVVEPLVSTQWFVTMAPLAEEGLAAVRSGAVKFVPDRWTKVYCDWLANIQDWCISRQLWWGHPIPVWYCDDCGEQTCTRQDPTECAHCGGANIRPDPDVLDTWFSSALWPFSTLDWPDQTPELQYFYPTSVLVTGYDIIYFWVARMIMMGMYLARKEPFGEVFIHGLVRDEKGRKMSKSLGNAVDPLELIDQYGTDAMRFGLTQLITHGQDLTYAPDRMVGARNFCNKLWNASRLVLMNIEEAPQVDLDKADLSLTDRWILSRHNRMLAELDRQLSGYNLSQAADLLYDYIWSEFCDWYLEIAKLDLYGEDGGRRATVQNILRNLLNDILRALHPFMPFITEEIWQRLSPEAGSIVPQPYPQADLRWLDDSTDEDMKRLQSVIVAIRSLRADLRLPPDQRVTVTMTASSAEEADVLEDQRGIIYRLAAVESLAVRAAPAEPPADALTQVASGTEVYLHLAGTIDPAPEIQRLQQAIADRESQRQRSQAKLQNEDFVSKAPAEIVAKERGRLAEVEQDIAKLKGQVEAVKAMRGDN